MFLRLGGWHGLWTPKLADLPADQSTRQEEDLAPSSPPPPIPPLCDRRSPAATRSRIGLQTQMVVPHLFPLVVPLPFLFAPQYPSQSRHRECPQKDVGGAPIAPGDWRRMLHSRARYTLEPFGYLHRRLLVSPRRSMSSTLLGNNHSSVLITTLLFIQKCKYHSHLILLSHFHTIVNVIDPT